ncbi:MAG: polyphosphate kinase 1, partial [Bacteroidota bacterium]
MQELNREISWLSFNERVLQEAENQDVPLVERIRFLAIFSNNLDEFFRVRVASVKRLASLKKYANTQERKTFNDTLERIRKTVLAQQKKFDAIYREDILPALAKSGVRIVENEPLQSAELEFVSSFFSDQLAPKLFPLLLKSGRDLPPLKDGEIYLAVKMSHTVTQALQYALVELPTRQMGRFVKLPTYSKDKKLMMLDDIVRQGLPELFSSLDFNSFSAHTIKITRDAELDIDNDIEVNYVEQLRKSIKKRKVGDPTRFIYDKEIPGDLLDFLLKKLKIQREDALPGGRYHNFRDFMAFPNLGEDKWVYPTAVPLHRTELDQAKSLLDHVEKHDVLLSFPYESFGYIVRFIREAAIDPSVFSIQISLYRLAKESS